MKLAWSNLLASEMRALRRHSVKRWGADVAARYLADVRDAAKALATRPDRARRLRGQLRLARVRSHYLIIDVDAETDRLTVVRVLHSAMDIARHCRPTDRAAASPPSRARRCG